MDHYQTLGVAKTATSDEIKKAYRKLASQHHPDKGGDTATFQKIQTAYDILSNPEKREQYDNPHPQFNGFSGDPDFNFNGFNMGEIFEQVFRQQRRNQPLAFRTTVMVSLEQVYHGDQQTLRLQTPQGVEMVNVQIPKGVQNGMQIRYENLLRNGSLIVEYRINPHLKFDCRGPDLYCNQQVSVLDLIVGSSFEFTTLSGKTFEVKIPPKTQPHMQLKITGQGMPVYGSTHYGDQIILIKPFIPDTIDSEITEAIMRSKSK